MIDVVLSPGETLPRVSSWLVVDLLRATTAMTAFFEAGGEELLPVATVEEARSLREGLGTAWLLLGERGGERPEGFDYGNSPREIRASPLQGRRGIVATTNGTGALLRAAEAGGAVGAACARNADAAARFAARRGGDVAVLCAGLHGRLGLDDVFCAGLLVERLRDLTGQDLGDGARLALMAWEKVRPDLLGAVRRTVHAGRLALKGFDEDVADGCQMAVSSVMPVLVRHGGRLVLVREEKDRAEVAEDLGIRTPDRRRKGCRPGGTPSEGRKCLGR